MPGSILDIPKFQYPDYSAKAQALRVKNLWPDGEMSPPQTPKTEGSKRSWERNFFRFKSKVKVWEAFYAAMEKKLQTGSESVNAAAEKPMAGST